MYDSYQHNLGQHFGGTEVLPRHQGGWIHLFFFSHIGINIQFSDIRNVNQKFDPKYSAGEH